MFMKLFDLLQRPVPYAPSPSIWTDTHISRQMLDSHLSDANDAASYRTSRREGICAYLHEAFGFAQAAGERPRLLDLGCGPGLYARWFAGRDVDVTGVDFSEHSLAYARAQAEAEGLPARFVQADYRSLDITGCFDAVMMVSEDFGVLDPAARHSLLCQVLALLRPGGHLALDVSADAAWHALREHSGWTAATSGFWSARPHVVLSKTFLHPEAMASSDLHVVIEDESMRRFYTHQTYYTPARIRTELESAGFQVKAVLGGLDGAAYAPDGKQIGVIAVKA